MIGEIMRVETEPEPFVRLELLQLLTKIAEFILDFQNPLSHAQEIARQAAQSHQADISTIFQIEGRSRLAFKAGVVYFRGNEIDLPKTFYELNWDVNNEHDMFEQGLTAYVAVSGQALSIPNYAILTDKTKHPAHIGKWDSIIYPEGVDHPETGFGCLYAVPLRRLTKGNPRDTVIGVFKIERRRHRLPFTVHDRMVFDLVAAHLSLILEGYHHMASRVLSEVEHTVGGGLEMAFLLLSTCEKIVQEGQRDASIKMELIASIIEKAGFLINRSCQRINIGLEATKDPEAIMEPSIKDLWQDLSNDLDIKGNERSDKIFLSIHPRSPITLNSKLRLKNIEYLDLFSILSNLLENAVRHAYIQEDGFLRSYDPRVELSIYLKTKDMNKYLIFEINDWGRGIPKPIIEEAKGTKYSEVLRLPSLDRPGRGTGLRRAYGFADCHRWSLNYLHFESSKFGEPGSFFELVVPDFRNIHVNGG